MSNEGTMLPPNDIDGNKKVKAIKRHGIVDKNGFLIAVMVIIVNVHDSKAAYFLMRVLKEICSGIKVILADGGYRGEPADNIKKKFEYAIQLVISAYKEQGFRGPFKRDGSWKELSYGWITIEDSAETMN